MLNALALAAALVSQFSPCSGNSCSARGYSFQSFAPAYRQAPAVPASLYYLADSTGKVWSSPDPAWLSTYVGQVNAAMPPSAPPAATPRYYYQFTSPFASPCAGGSCPR